jgi:D-sedoheptulose 7-phosphate isomerase
MGQSVRVSAMAGALLRREAAGVGLRETAPALAGAAYAMAARFHRAGKLMAFGGAGTDASHVAVEFMHPVIVGKPALPALALSGDPAIAAGTVGPSEVYAHQLRYFGDPADIALGFSVNGDCLDVRRGLALARELGLLTVALVGADGGAIAADAAVEHVLLARDSDPGVVKEIHVTMYHLLWELVHALLERPGFVGPRVYV